MVAFDPVGELAAQPGGQELSALADRVRRIDPEVLRAVARGLGSIVEGVDRSLAALGRHGEEVRAAWGGRGAEAFTDYLGDLDRAGRSTLEATARMRERVDGAGQALDGLRREVDGHVMRALDAARRARAEALADPARAPLAERLAARAMVEPTAAAGAALARAETDLGDVATLLQELAADAGAFSRLPTPDARPIAPPAGGGASGWSPIAAAGESIATGPALAETGSGGSDSGTQGIDLAGGSGTSDSTSDSSDTSSASAASSSSTALDADAGDACSGASETDVSTGNDVDAADGGSAEADPGGEDAAEPTGSHEGAATEGAESADAEDDDAEDDDAVGTGADPGGQDDEAAADSGAGAPEDDATARSGTDVDAPDDVAGGSDDDAAAGTDTDVDERGDDAAAGSDADVDARDEDAAADSGAGAPEDDAAARSGTAVDAPDDDGAADADDDAGADAGGDADTEEDTDAEASDDDDVDAEEQDDGAVADGADADVGAAVDPDTSDGAGPTGGPQSQVGDWIREAMAVLQAEGVPLDKMDPDDIATIIEHESGGDPEATNDWDSNAAKGTPSQGLMQTIGPTFDAYKLEGHDEIQDPIDNIIAGVRYAIDRYGSVSQVPGVEAVGRGDAYVGY